MAHEYEVHYDIKVTSNQAAKAMQSFADDVKLLSMYAIPELNKIEKEIKQLQNVFGNKVSQNFFNSITKGAREAAQDVKQSFGIISKEYKSFAAQMSRHPINIAVKTKGLHRTIKEANSLLSKLGKKYVLDVNTSKITGHNEAYRKLNQISDRLERNYEFKLSTSGANRKIDLLIQKLKSARKLCEGGGRFDVGSTATGGAGGSRGSGSTGGSNSNNRNTNHNNNNNNNRNTNNQRRGGQNGSNPKGNTLIPLYADGSKSSIGAAMAKGMGVGYAVGDLLGYARGTLIDLAEYDDAMAMVRNIGYANSDKSAEGQERFKHQFANMQRTVRDVGVRTKFSAPEVANAAKFLAMAGLDSRGIQQSIAPIANLALIARTDLAETADLVTNIMTAYGIDPSNMNQVADIMTSVFTNSNVSLIDMAESFKYSAGLMRAGGFDFQEMAAAIGMLGNAGIHGSTAGTSLRTIIGNIVKPTKPQSAAWDKAFKMKDAHRKITRNEDGSIRSLMDILAEFEKHNVSLEGFYRMIHKTAAQGAVALVKQSGEWRNVTTQAFNATGLADELAGEMVNTVSGLWYQMTSSLTEVALQEFERNESAIKTFLADTVGFVKSDEFKDLAKNILGFVMELAGWIKEIILTIMRLYKQFKPVVDTFIKFQMFATVAKMVVAGLTAIGTAGYKLVNAFRAVKTSADQASASASTFSTIKSNILNSNVTKGVAGGIGGIGGMYLGQNLGEAIGLSDTAAGVMGMGVGGVMSMLPMFGPAGIAAAAGVGLVAGIGYIIASKINSMREANKVIEEMANGFDKFGTSILKLESPMDLMNAQIRAMSSEWASAGEKIEETIRLTLQYLGITTGGKDDAAKTPYSALDPEARTKANKIIQHDSTTGKYFTFDGTKAEDIRRVMGLDTGRFIPDENNGGWDNDISGKVKVGKQWAKIKWSGNNSSEAQESRSLAATIISDYQNNKSKIKNLFENELDLRLAGAKTVKEYDIVLKEFKDKYVYSMYDSSQKGAYINEEMSVPELTNSYMLKDFFKMALADMENNRKYKGIRATLENLEKTPTKFTADALLSLSDKMPFLTLYNTYNPDEAGSALKTMQQVHALVTGGKVDEEWLKKYQSAEDIKKLRAEGRQLTGLGVEVVKTAYSAYTSLVQSTSDKSKKDYYKKYYGQLFESAEKVFGIKLDNQPSATPNSNLDGDNNYNGIDDGTGNNGGGNKFDADGANEKYKPTNMTKMEGPKQVIVNIGSLMNLEKVDMNDPQIQSVVADLKTKLADALIDVVHDFDLTYMN